MNRGGSSLSVPISDVSEPGEIARVRAVSEDRCHFTLERRRDSRIFTITSSGALEYAEGDILLVCDDPPSVDKLPDTLWPDDIWVGVVRLKLADITIVDVGYTHKRIPTSSIEYSELNTVEASDIAGVVRVLAKEPVWPININTIDDEVLKKFKEHGKSEEKFADIGGMKAVLDRTKELVELQLVHNAELIEIGAKPLKGVLFTGPPGTGKTMLARVIANDTAATFYEISGPEVLSKWYGESEQLLRKIFDDAAKCDRAIIFFDEIDSLASQRTDESHEASRRVVAQLLTLMDGFEQKSNILIIGATNRPDDIDPALRRPGRFDWEIQFDLPAEGEREEILKIIAQKMKVAPGLPHSEIARRTEGWSGAELSLISAEAAILAVKDGRKEIVDEDYWNAFERVRSQLAKKAAKA
jgi:transitional endoplasmic reticulum ATPase